MKKNYLFSLLLIVVFSITGFAQKRVLWYTDGMNAVYEEPLRDSLVATGDFKITGEVSALEFSTMTTANSFFLYDLVIMNESGPSNSGLNFGTGQAGFPKPLLTIEPYTFDDWFLVIVNQTAGVASVDKGAVDAVQKFIVKVPNHPIFTGMLSAPGANDTITWTTGWNTVGGDNEAHVCKIHLDDATDIAKDATLIASCEELEREDPVAGKDNGFMWAVEENSVTKRIFLMGAHVMWNEFITPAYWHLLTNAAYWCVGMDVPAISSKPRLSNQFESVLYPSVATDQFSIRFSMQNANVAKINIIDLTGKLAQSFERNLVAGDQKLDVNISGLDAGMYVVTMEINKNISINKLIVK